MRTIFGHSYLALGLLTTSSSDISLKVVSMRRRAFLLLLILLLTTGLATGVHASTDCQQWFAAYKQQLAHSQAVKRLRAAKLRARRYAQMKLAGYVKPKAAVRPHRHYRRRPTMTRAEMLRRLNLACGVLPERVEDQPVIKEETLGDFLSHRAFDTLPLLPSDDDQLIAQNLPPQLPLTEQTSNDSTQNGYQGYFPPLRGGGGFPGFPGSYFPPVHTSQPPPPPPVAPVPEPESLVLILTGLAGGVGMVRRRMKASRT